MVIFYNIICVLGRTHQLRVHCCHVGHPIIGDISYNADSEPYRMMLHAYHLYIPMTHETIDIVSSDPFVPTIDNKWSPSTVFRTISDINLEKGLGQLYV